MSTLYKRPSGWYLLWYCTTGCETHLDGPRRHCTSLRTKDGKQAAQYQKEFDASLADTKARLRLGLQPPARLTEPWTLLQWIDRYEQKVTDERIVSPATWDRSERWALHQVQQFRPAATLADLTADWMGEYERAEKHRLSPHTWNSRRATLRAIGNRCMAWGWLPDNPFRHLTRAKAKKKRPKRLLQEQLPIILAAIPNQFWRLVTLFFYATGVRRQELCDLPRAAVRRAQGYLEIESNKENEPKVIALTPAIDWIVTEAEKIAPSQYVFSRDGRPLHPEAVKNYYRWISKKVGFPVSPHRFRHSHGSHRMEAGDNLKTVSDTLGHADIRTTASFYLDISLDGQRAALSRLPIEQLLTLSRETPVTTGIPGEKRSTTESRQQK